MTVTTMGRALLMLAVAALVIGADGYAASQPGNTRLAQRGGRGGRGQGSPGIRALVKGRVTAVDSTLGRVTLAIGGAIVEAEFRPAVLADVKPGDDVMVTVELIDTRVGAVAGAVTAVDAASGAVTVSTPGGPWTNTFLPGAVAGIKPGDQAVLKLDLLDLGPSVIPPSMPSPGQPNQRGNGPTQ